MTLVRGRPSSSGGSSGPTGLLTPRATASNTTAVDGDMVEVDASSGVRTVTGPAAGAALRWGAKKIDGNPDAPGNTVNVAYLDRGGASATLALTVPGDSVILYGSGSGYGIESGYTPPATLLAVANDAAVDAAAAVRSTQWFGSVAATPRPETADPVLWVGWSGTVPTNAIDDFDVIAVLTAP